MNYDKNSFLAGVSVGRTLKGWAAGGTPTPTSVDVGKDILFIDYDGTPVDSWGLEELAGKTALPTAPTHEGLTFQEWNWTLEQLKAENVPMVVGANYITDDGKTRLYINVIKYQQSILFHFTQSIANEVAINFGDGTDEVTVSGTGRVSASHTYAKEGDYVITLTPSDLCILGFENKNVLEDLSIRTSMLAIELGRNVISVGDDGFFAFRRLSSISIPNTVTSVGPEAFRDCKGLTGVSIPASVESFKDYVFHDDISLMYVSFPMMQNVTRASWFDGCSALSRVNIPLGVTEISSGGFRSCPLWFGVYVPPSVSTIRSMAFYNVQTTYYDFTHHSSVPSLMYSDVFSGNRANVKFFVPSSLLGEWKAATNWAAYADNIIGVSSDGEQ